MNTTMLKNYGIDFEQGFDRCIHDEELYRSLLELFLEDDAYERALKAYEEKDYPKLFKCFHELKGACGNAGMTELFNVTSSFVEDFRSGDYQVQKIDEYMERIETSYEKTKNGVTQFLEAN